MKPFAPRPNTKGAFVVARLAEGLSTDEILAAAAAAGKSISRSCVAQVRCLARVTAAVDAEFAAMQQIALALDALPPAKRVRVLAWLAMRYPAGGYP